MNQEAINQIISYLDKIGEKIGRGAETVWPWLIRQQYIDSIVAIGVLLFFLLGCIFCAHKFIKIRDCFEKLSEKIYCALLIIFCFGLLISIVNFFVEGLDFLNPEYWALRDLLRQIR